jgi:hypothetical protein
MIRDDTFKLRVNTTERELIAAVAQRLDRNESDAVRLLVKERAREMGILPGAPKEDRPAVQTAGAI